MRCVCVSEREMKMCVFCVVYVCCLLCLWSGWADRLSPCWSSQSRPAREGGDIRSLPLCDFAQVFRV